MAGKTKAKKEASKMQAAQPSDNNTKVMIAGFVALAVIIIAIFSIKYFYTPAPKETEDSYVYNGFPFVKSEGLWHTQVQLKDSNLLFEVPLHYGPREVENIYFTGDKDRFNYYLARYGYNQTTKEGWIFVTFDPREDNQSYTALAAGELSLTIAQALGLEPIASCIVNSTAACASRPIIDCDNTASPVIYLKKSNDTKVEIEANCIIVQGDGEGLLKATDRLIFSLYGIMQLDKNQSYIFLYAARKDATSSVDVDFGIYDRKARCAWSSGELSIQILDADNNVIAERKLAISEKDQFLDYCVTEKPISIQLSAEDYAKAKSVNGTFVTAKNRTLQPRQVANILDNNKGD